MAFSWTDLLIPAAIGASAFFGSNASQNAADTAANAAKDSGAQQLAMFNQNRTDLAPYRETGNQALFALSDLYGVPRPDGQGGFTTGKSFQGTPGYQFQLGEGINALDRSAASRGRLFSGAQGKALTAYGQNMAQGEFNNYTNSLRSLANIGQTATGQTAQLGANAAANAGNAGMAAGNARASGYTGQAQALNQGIGNALYYYGR